jgi:NADH:ubiquinone oxidoreductase subunit 6 (subunit J)
MEKELDILNRIQKVDAPPFLYTRILTRVQNKVRETVPVKWAVAAAACLLILITINISVIQSSKQSNTTNLSEVFSLKTNNSLYNE